MSIEVRRLSADDWRDWRNLRLRSLVDSPDAFGSTSVREEAFTEETWRQRAEDSTIAYVDGVPAAMGGSFDIDQQRTQIVAMWTDPAFRQRGLARLVLEDIVARARERGRRVMLDVTRGNDAARATYERFGFVATGRAGPLREGSDLLVDEMVLPA
ncbi:MAG TPA: GNAT family N-acetyltransferase [Nocardioides sp.]